MLQVGGRGEVGADVPGRVPSTVQRTRTQVHQARDIIFLYVNRLVFKVVSYSLV